MSQPYTLLPDGTATCFLAVPLAVACHTRCSCSAAAISFSQTPLTRRRVISAAGILKANLTETMVLYVHGWAHSLVGPFDGVLLFRGEERRRQGRRHPRRPQEAIEARACVQPTPT